MSRVPSFGGMLGTPHDSDLSLRHHSKKLPSGWSGLGLGFKFKVKHILTVSRYSEAVAKTLLNPRKVCETNRVLARSSRTTCSFSSGQRQQFGSRSRGAEAIFSINMHKTDYRNANPALHSPVQTDRHAVPLTLPVCFRHPNMLRPHDIRKRTATQDEPLQLILSLIHI